MSCERPKMIITERPYQALVRVWHGETWYDPLPQLIDPVTGDPWDITGVTIEFILRQTATSDDRMALLTSVGSLGILKEDAVNGLAAVFWPQANVESVLPVSPPEGWWHMQRLSWTDPSLGAVRKILGLGPLHVFPAEDDAT